MNVNDIIHGFKLERQDTVPEAASEAFVFKHIKSGARLLFLKNNDDNKVFSISFRTPPPDDTGVAHITEHSVLCGSRKFPLKEPFVELVKGSLNTFLNAMTFPDKTMYPIASQNDKDFRNLMDVYLDAVFYPVIYNKPEILLQEGWHYEIEKAEEPLRYSGVVYNEMKGARSSPDDILEEEVMKALFPDTAYAKDSGGNPEFVPQLTYEGFLDFHKRYYSPANSYIYLYGDMNIEDQLRFIDEEYLSAFDIIEVDSELESQPAFEEVHQIKAEYPIGAEESADSKTFLSYDAVICEAGDAELVAAMSLMETVLLKTAASPLRKAIIDAGIGSDVDSNFEISVRQPYLHIEVSGAEADMKDELVKVIKDTLSRICEEGLDNRLVEAALNAAEFKLREADFGNVPKGLIYNISVMNNWLYGKDPLDTLRYENIISSLREKIGTDYFQQIIKKYILDNKHAAVITLSPSKTVAGELQARVAAELASRKAEMSEEDILAVIESTAKLKKMQQTPDSPEALATIPLLDISDIRKEIDWLPAEEREINGAKVLFTDIDTSGIAYVDLYFDASTISQELLPYAYLLQEFIGEVDTDKHGYADLSNEVGFHTGGIGFHFDVHTINGKPDEYKTFFTVSGKSFVRKLPELFELITEIITSSRYTDKIRIRELLFQARTSMEANMMNSSVQVMMHQLSAQLSCPGAVENAGSLGLFRLVQKLTDSFDECWEDMCSKLVEVSRLLFRANGVIAGITSRGKDYPAFEKACADMLDSLESKELPKYKYKFDIRPAQEALSSSSQVQYVGKGANLFRLGYDFCGSLRVMEVMLKYEYFWTRIRVQGGAYGAMIRLRNNGDIIFASYRDPNLKNTVDVFDETPGFLKDFDADSREMTKYIIGTISSLDSPLTPRYKGLRSQLRWISSASREKLQKHRDEVLAANPEDIRKLASVIEAAMKENCLCVFGNENVINDNAGLFEKVIPVMG